VQTDEYLPAGKSIILGLQHAFAMFGATVLAPLLMGFDPNLTIFITGIGTILFFLMTGGRMPSYLGSSFAFRHNNFFRHEIFSIFRMYDLCCFCQCLTA
jgi:putative pyrimidine permease RutG